MTDAFKIYVDQLRDGHTELLDEEFSPELMEVEEDELRYLKPIKVSGETYLAEHELVLHLNIETEATIPCAICNEPASVKILLEGVYHAVPYEEIKSGIYVFKDLIRESLLLETPRFAECEGRCPRRKEVEKFLKEEASNDRQPPEEGQKPFANLK